ncbi:apolipoprotein N-acyltransferase [Bordetella sp. 02P26C-1]|uniref:apolipoprotein N-acyltransferase n=1 Tax=Bordetella sp. 02P26C-1 TaxID=2683195 RepID=UPI003FA44487
MMTFGRAPRWALVGLVAAGAVHAMTFAPGPLPVWSLALVEILTLACLAYTSMQAPRVATAFLRGWVFNFASYSLGLYWIFVSLHHYGGLAAPLAVAGVLALAAFLALFPAVACALARWLTPPLPSGEDAPSSWPRVLMAPLCFAAAWGLLEWLRATVLTGFPWLNIGYAHVDSPIAGWAPVLGVHGMAFFAAFAAAALAGLWRPQSLKTDRPDVPRNLVCALALLLVLAGWPLANITWSRPTGEPLRVRLVQGNVEQSQKFDPQLLESGIQRHLELAALPTPAAQLIILPETVLPIFQDRLDPAIWQAWRSIAARHTAVIAMGVPLRTRGADGRDSFTNSVIGFTAETPLEQLRSGTPALRYDKQHLVPWGEYVPPGFRWFIDMLNIPLGDFDRGAERQPPFHVGDQYVAFNICYEDLFGIELLPALHPSDNGEPGATILANVSNLGWFGNTWALRQHLQIGRLRTLETARPMLAATNTGITAAIDAQGQVAAQLPPHQAGILPVSVQGMTGLTPYARWGDKPVLGILALILVVAGIARRRQRNL